MNEIQQGPPSYRDAKPRNQEVLIHLSGVTKTYERGGEKLEVLANLDLEVPRGSFEALMGPSGSGKSTLLNLMAGLDRPTSGTIEIDKKRIDQMSESQLATWRAGSVGFIFQSYNLLPVLTAVENVELPLLLTPVPASERRKRSERSSFRTVRVSSMPSRRLAAASS